MRTVPRSKNDCEQNDLQTSSSTRRRSTNTSATTWISLSPNWLVKPRAIEDIPYYNFGPSETTRDEKAQKKRTKMSITTTDSPPQQKNHVTRVDHTSKRTKTLSIGSSTPVAQYFWPHFIIIITCNIVIKNT